MNHFVCSLPSDDLISEMAVLLRSYQSHDTFLSTCVCVHVCPSVQCVWVLIDCWWGGNVSVPFPLVSGIIVDVDVVRCECFFARTNCARFRILLVDAMGCACDTGFRQDEMPVSLQWQIR